MTSFLYSRGSRIFDCVRFAEPLRERMRQRAQEVCAAAGVKIEHVNESHIRKEDLVARALAARGDAPGLVHLLPGAWAEGDAISAGRCLQRLARAALVRIGVVVGQVGLTLLFGQHLFAGEQLHHSGGDFVQHHLQRLVGRRGHFDQDRFAFGVAPVYAV